MDVRAAARRRAGLLRRSTLVVTAALSLVTLAGCAAALDPAGGRDTPIESAPGNPAMVDAACATSLENYTASLESSSTGREHPGNYTVRAATTADFATLLPLGTLDGTRVDCVISAYSSIVESTQITGVVLNPSADVVASVRDALTAAGWEPDVIESGVSFRGPEPEMSGAQTYVLDAPTAERVGVPIGAFAVIAGKWDLWGAF
ncbi:hypothetical protein [Microbacterium sp. VKM Ac-2923]|uniref:hypothetical protein n=1 Tax=Microbacterium sp. VKM Ac-2923 TaxID=2929476 RepID=UPI001FB28EFB|nr:hypothetical protein [Microbacterium sp. VKM Ac-2923]MCJ1707119.1 hypothetical protein [Microbacterium sp. VKM Ac-2923]